MVFPKPIDFEIVAPHTPEQMLAAAARGEGWPHSEIMRFTDELRKYGMDEGAVVVRRSESNVDQKRRHNWGLVINLQSYRPANGPFMPMTIKWFSNNSESKMWPQDLVLIHSSYTWTELADVIKYPAFEFESEP